jgi:FAD/FMN-containing dehydrogenase/Fe-S oxidoreductase
MHSTLVARHTPHTDAVDQWPVDADKLARALSSRIKGEVRFGDGDRALYAADASNYRQPPIGVVLPRGADDVIAAVAVAREFDAPVLMRGGGTSLAGQCCNTAIVLDTTKYFNRLVSIDPARRRATVEPGIVLDELRKAAAPHGLTFGPDPSTHSRCALGGMIGNNSCGVHSVLAEFYGPGPHTMHQVEELDVLLYDGTRLTVGPTSEDELRRIAHEGGRRGEIYRALGELRDRYADEIRRRFPQHLVRRASGYNLDQLLPEHGFNVARALVGTEGTCVAILGATVTLIHNPTCRVLLVLGYSSVYDAGDHVPQIRELKPIGLEGMDENLIKDMRENGIHPDALKLMPDGKGFLVVEFGADTMEEATSLAQRAREALSKTKNPPAMKIYADQESQTKIWEVREAGLGATAFVPNKPDSWPGWEDSSVPVDKVGDYLRDLRDLFTKYDYHPSLYGHFGQGCIHCRVNFDLYTADGIERYRAFGVEAAELACGKYGGSLSGEHGDGQARGELLPIMFGDTLMDAFHEFQAIWDPQGRMNPDKTVSGFTRSENLRLGPEYAPQEPETHFQFPEDRGSFARATLRCVGVGLCRRHEGGTMCPSYMATREEKHATRGRTHLLFEMLRGELVDEGWKSEEVKESLDLCLACKGCKGECPVHVDVATYKAEFLSHYYEHHARPRNAYAFGLIHRWAALGTRLPRLTNAATHLPLVSRAAKWAMGMSPHRSVPKFATTRFTRQYASRRRTAPPIGTPQRVLLWPDTFNNHFFPKALSAAVDVLESVGCTIALPPEGLCCGRPLYDFGMLDHAKHQLREIMGRLSDEIAAGTPIIGLEPSCVSVFRDELVNLFPRDENARRLHDQVVMFGDFLGQRLDAGAKIPTLHKRALVHAHCHHKAVLGVTGEQKVVRALGLEAQWPQSGCCGMAGAFGFEKEHYDVSMAIGERVLLPAVRDADRETLIVADGFSCREQIAQSTKRRALHLAEVVQLALRDA